MVVTIYYTAYMSLPDIPHFPLAIYNSAPSPFSSPQHKQKIKSYPTNQGVVTLAEGTLR